MDRLRASRKQYRRLFTKACNEFEREESILSEEEKIEKLRVIEEKAKLMIESEEQVREALFGENEQEDLIDREMDESEAYIDKWRVLENKLSKILESKREDSLTSIESVSHNTMLHYPKIKLPSFDGNVKNWLGFWGQFQKIDKDPNLDAHDKFAYLSQAMEKGTSAEDLIKSFPPGGESYKKAINQLQARFGREELLIEVYVRDLLSLVLQKHNSVKSNSLRRLYDQLETKLRALDALGVARDKYAAMLYPLVESSLPDDTLRAWERFRSAHRRSREEDIVDEEATSTQLIYKTDLDRLLRFLQDEVQGEERVSLAVNGFDPVVRVGRGNSRRENSSFKREESSLIPTAAGLFTSTKENHKVCIFCIGRHNSWECDKVRKMSLEERQIAISKARCCFLCLKKGHEVKKCKTKTGCLVCGRRHHLLICRTFPQTQVNSIADKKNEAEKSFSQQDEALANFSRAPNVLLQTLTVIMKGNGVKRVVRAIIDSASQRSYILRRTAREMGYKSTKKEYLRHSLFGGANTGVCDHDVFTIYLSDVSETYNCHFDVLSQSVICETMPPIGQGLWLKELKDSGIRLTDRRDGPIEVLIGADVAGKLMTGGYKRFPSGVTAIETKLGWTVMGRVTEVNSEENSVLVAVSMLTRDACVSDLWNLDSLGITDPSEQKTKLELQEAARQHFLDTVKIDNGRFMVHLPWIEGHSPLPNNYELALKRLNSLVKRLKSEGFYQAYEKVFIEWLQEGIIEEVPANEAEGPCHYLPHRHVIKENSTTKIRPVFDASAKQKGSPSLNDCLEKGLNLIELIPSILTRFRLKKIGVIADIRKAFLQISLFPSDKNFLRFLWSDSDGNLKCYRHCRVVFGVSCSPFLLGATIHYHLQMVLQRHEEGDLTYPRDMIQKLMNSFYVDNCVTSVRNESELECFKRVATEIMAERKFELRGWEYTDPISDNTKDTNVLGMLWNRSSDTLRVNIAGLEDICFEKITKRIILATAHRIFDPLGITCPICLVPKLLLQRTWENKLNWEQEVDDKTKSEFLRWIDDLSYLEKVEIPRWLACDDMEENYSLHFFCDASRYAYAAVAFIRIETKDSVKVQLLQARSRVAPCGKRETTIARLELLAATIASRLASIVMKEFQTPEIHFWTDSTTVLTWIKEEEPWGVFVHNRVQEIRRLTSSKSWRHVPGSINPADLPSRGCSARHLAASKWWEGPNWLYLSSEEWPVTEFVPNREEVVSERKKKIISSLMTVESSSLINSQFSSYEKTIRLVAWIRRFIYNCRNQQRKSGELTVSELNTAEKSVIRLIQTESFEGIKDKRLEALHPFYDEGILRTKTAVFRRADTEEFRTPAILPGKHPIVKSLIIEEHKKRGHTGTSYILNALRERFWVLCGRRSVRSVLRTCVVCRRHLSKNVSPTTAPPPRDRVQDSAIFQTTGVDFAGPLILRDKTKAWICLFTCAVYRAVHLELVTSLSTEVFLQAFHRFIARRGTPSTVYSDNGSNFVGAANALASIDFQEVSRQSREKRVVWKFIPPGAPWWGGWWERLVGMMKQILRKILGRASLNYEEMYTVICNCEAILNDRPLTVVSADPDFTALTPAYFLKEIKTDRMPEINLNMDSDNLRRRLRYIQNIREAFRRRFRQEYLGTLTTAKPKPNRINCVKVGDIVLIGGEDRKRLSWPLGRIMELLPGADGVSRRARVKTQRGELVRALQSLYPLEVSSVGEISAEKSDSKIVEEDISQRPVKHSKASRGGDIVTNDSSLVTRCGRKIRVPNKLSL